MTDASEILEKMARAICDADNNNWGRLTEFEYHGESVFCRDNYRRAVRAALAILTKPENITPEMLEAFWFEAGSLHEDDDDRARKAIAASIAALLKARGQS